MSGSRKPEGADHRPLLCSIGIMAYNEERNIGRLLEALRHQKLSCCSIDEIVVVASGCTDRTEALAEESMALDPRVRLIRQARREGKSRAINLYLASIDTTRIDVCILQSGDTLPEPETIDRLVRPIWADARVGMTGAHVVPVNGEGRFVGDVVHTLWRLHHRLALESPKLGELVAFRNVVPRIPDDSAVDEVSVESAVVARGLTLRYAADAIVRNKGPETIADFLRQRRRIHAGHLRAARQSGYAPSTMSLSRVGRHFLAETFSSPGRLVPGFGAAALEATGRALGAYDYYITRRSHAVWEIAATTKNVQGN